MSRNNVAYTQAANSIIASILQKAALRLTDNDEILLIGVSRPLTLNVKEVKLFVVGREESESESQPKPLTYTVDLTPLLSHFLTDFLSEHPEEELVKIRLEEKSLTLILPFGTENHNSLLLAWKLLFKFGYIPKGYILPELNLVQ